MDIEMFGCWLDQTCVGEQPTGDYLVMARCAEKCHLMTQIVSHRTLDRATFNIFSFLEKTMRDHFKDMHPLLQWQGGGGKATC